jgi:hypothetical protein
MPETDDLLVDLLDPQAVKDNPANRRAVVRHGVQAVPAHEQFIAQNRSASVTE